jgi:hypothetical protein
MMLNLSQASLKSHSSIWSAIIGECRPARDRRSRWRSEPAGGPSDCRAKTPALVGAFIHSAQRCAQSTLPNRPRPCSTCFIRSRSGASNCLIQNR